MRLALIAAGWLLAAPWLYRIAPVATERPWDDATWKALGERFSRRAPK